MTQLRRYRAVLENLGEMRDEWGLFFEPRNTKIYHFPSAADRVIYWAPDTLAARMEWHVPNGSYEMNNAQMGSDHKPVFLEAVLRVVPEAPLPREQSPLARTRFAGADPSEVSKIRASESMSERAPCPMDEFNERQVQSAGKASLWKKSNS